MTARSTILEKMFSFVLLSGYIIYILPLFKPGNLFAAFVIVASIGLISYSLGKIFSGDGGRAWLVPILLVIVGNVLFFSTVAH